MDGMQEMILWTAGIMTAAYAGSQLMVRLPWTRAWVQGQAVKGYNYLDSVKEEVPEEFKDTWQDAYDTLDAVIDAFADDKLTVREIRHVMLHGLALIAEVKGILG